MRRGLNGHIVVHHPCMGTDKRCKYQSEREYHSRANRGLEQSSRSVLHGSRFFQPRFKVKLQVREAKVTIARSLLSIVTVLCTSLDPIGQLQCAHVGDDIGNFSISYTSNRRHISKIPVMLSNTLFCR